MSSSSEQVPGHELHDGSYHAPAGTDSTVGERATRLLPVTHTLCVTRIFAFGAAAGSRAACRSPLRYRMRQLQHNYLLYAHRAYKRHRMPITVLVWVHPGWMSDIVASLTSCDRSSTVKHSLSQHCLAQTDHGLWQDGLAQFLHHSLRLTRSNARHSMGRLLGSIGHDVATDEICLCSLSEVR